MFYLANVVQYYCNHSHIVKELDSIHFLLSYLHLDLFSFIQCKLSTFIWNIFYCRVKSLQTQLAEKDAMIRVFQRSPMIRSSSVHTLSYSPHHSPRPSITSSLSRQFDMPSSIYATIRHVKTGK